MPFQVPQDFVFLARCVGILSGMCTGLDEEFNVWEHLAPFAQRLIAQEARQGAEFWIEEAKTRLRTIISLPLKVDSLFARLERGDVAMRTPELNRQVKQLERAIRQLVAALLFAVLLLGGLQLYLNGERGFGQVLFGGAILCLLWILFLSRRS
jgi:predicted unusual protein kinase regulating ubiquinone biosynthesis (AarF/ABC1/UbiB family)